MLAVNRLSMIRVDLRNKPRLSVGGGSIRRKPLAEVERDSFVSLFTDINFKETTPKRLGQEDPTLGEILVGLDD